MHPPPLHRIQFGHVLPCKRQPREHGSVFLIVSIAAARRHHGRLVRAPRARAQDSDSTARGARAGTAGGARRRIGPSRTAGSSSLGASSISTSPSAVYFALFAALELLELPYIGIAGMVGQELATGAKLF